MYVFKIILLLFYIALYKITGKFENKIVSSLESIGPIFVKFGQFLSMQKSMFNKNLSDKLEDLCSNVKQDAKYQIQKLFIKNYKKLPEEIFDKFEYNAIASGSIAQVHKCVYKGNLMCVKIVKPSTVKNIKKNLIALKFIGFLLQIILLKRDLYFFKIVKLFENSIYKEINMKYEYYNSCFFDNQKSICTTYDILHEYLCKDIMIMKYKFNNHYLDEEINTSKNIKAIKSIIHCFINQVFYYGVFHGDYHKKNMCIINNKVHFIDFGIIGNISNKSRIFLFWSIILLLRGKYGIVIKVLQLGDLISKNIDIHDASSDVKEIFNIFSNETKDLNTLMQKFIEFTETYSYNTESDVLLIKKNIRYIQSLSNNIAPSINFINLMRNELYKIAINPKFIALSILTMGTKYFMLKINELQD